MSVISYGYRCVWQCNFLPLFFAIFPMENCFAEQTRFCHVRAHSNIFHFRVYSETLPTYKLSYAFSKWCDEFLALLVFSLNNNPSVMKMLQRVKKTYACILCLCPRWWASRGQVQTLLSCWVSQTLFICLKEMNHSKHQEKLNNEHC